MSLKLSTVVLKLSISSSLPHFDLMVHTFFHSVVIAIIIIIIGWSGKIVGRTVVWGISRGTFVADDFCEGVFHCHSCFLLVGWTMEGKKGQFSGH